MNLVGMMPVRNEGWCLGVSLRVALEWCDQVIVLVHASQDETAAIATAVAQEFHPRVIVVADDQPVWDEMRHRQAMLELARAAGATHLAIIDADELLTFNLIPLIRDHIANMPAGGLFELPGYNLRGGLDQYHDNGVWGHRVFSMAFRDDARLNWAGDRFHQRAPLPAGALRPWRLVPHGKGGILHLWGASEARLVAKHALYKLTERERWPNKPVREIDTLYNLAIYGDAQTPAANWRFGKTPYAWVAGYSVLIEKYLDLERQPWQLAACREILRRRPELAEGLDLFGLFDDDQAMAAGV